MQSSKPKKQSQHKLRDAFNTEGELGINEASGLFSHTTYKSKKKPPTNAAAGSVVDLPAKYNYLWYMKKEGNANLAEREVVAQEFFRLLIPSHTKTRLVRENVGEGTYIISKQIPGFRSLEHINTSEIAKNIKDGLDNKAGGFTGLGDVVVMALLFNERDLKLGNMGVDDQGRIVKIDGDWCFAGLRDSNYIQNITAKNLRELPSSRSFKNYNWLDEREGTRNKTSNILTNEIINHPALRLEINNALLRALLIPDELARVFVDSYIEDDAKSAQLAEEFITKRRQLEVAAMQNTSFKAYLQTPAAQEQMDAQIQYLSQFKTTKKNFILKKLPDTENLMRNKFLEMRDKAPKIVLSKVIDEESSKELLKRLNDPKMIEVEYINHANTIMDPLEAKDKDDQTFLHYAAKCGRLDIVSQLLKQGADPNKTDKNGKTAFQIAIENNRPACACEILNSEQFILPNSKDIDLNKKYPNGETLLHRSVRRKQENVVKKLLVVHANVDAVDNSGNTALHLALKNKDVTTSSRLLDEKCNVLIQDNEGKTCLHVAAENNVVDVIPDILKSKNIVNIQDYQGRTAFHCVAEKGYEDIAISLLQSDGDPFIPDKKGWDAFSYAVELGFEARMMMEIVWYACKYDKPNLVTQLLKQGANPNAVDENGDTPLHLAASFVQVEIAKELLNHGASILKNKEGNIPAHEIVQDKYTAILTKEKEAAVAKLFLEIKMDLHVQNKEGATIFHFIAESGNNNLLLFLTEKQKFNLDIKDHKLQSTPAHVAASSRRYETLVLLAKLQADFSIKNHNDDTALDILIRKNQWKVLIQVLCSLKKNPYDIGLDVKFLVNTFMDYVKTFSEPSEQYQLLDQVLNRKNALGEILVTAGHSPRLFQEKKADDVLSEMRELHANVELKLRSSNSPIG